ncbi:YciI family protein [Virgisporangium aurantiacum]|uniref:YCII-related domain-containing protein n=1 Tax=Virgisporangium aurantiacum TaxID=175570 RepID=A0A8J3ZB49_9ACTN|nr:YciI family protein [Virgisporangium aurantiacum]GIJ60904.1 hypothetical protein Vau01_084200 [Virgisporangium aurantiacum]
MEYAVLIYGDEKAWAARTEEELRDLDARHKRFAALVAERGTMRAGRELASVASATTVRKQGDGVSVTDGPFAETAEVLGGLYLVEAADLDEVTAWVRVLPEATIEIRPIA